MRRASTGTSEPLRTGAEEGPGASLGGAGYGRAGSPVPRPGRPFLETRALRHPGPSVSGFTRVRWGSHPPQPLLLPLELGVSQGAGDSGSARRGPLSE